MPAGKKKRKTRTPSLDSVVLSKSDRSRYKAKTKVEDDPLSLPPKVSDGHVPPDPEDPTRVYGEASTVQL